MRGDSLKRMVIAYIGLGGNVASAVGPPEKTLAAALVRLGALVRVVARSRLYSTEPVGYAEQPRFVNAVVGLETSLEADALLKKLLEIEKEFGRDRSAGIMNGPRTLDLDLLLYGQQVIREAALHVPHPRLAERAFVLVPLSEIAAEVRVPGVNGSVQELLERLKTKSAQDADAVIAIDSDIWAGA